MAEQELAPGAETDETKTPAGTEAEPGKEPAAEEGADDTDADSPYAELAQKIGWVPKDQYQGPPELWKPAEQFILDGRDIQRNTAAELKALRATVENISKTSASIVEQQVESRVAELVEQYNAAVEDGKGNEAFKLAGQIQALRATPGTNGRSAPPAESIAFADRNKGWFQKDPLATSMAIDVCNRLAAQGYDNATQLDAAEKEVRRNYPHLFGGGVNGQKPAPGVNAPGSRAPQGKTGRDKGFADLPPEAQRVANDMVSRGVFKDKTPEEGKALYAKNYWQNVESKA